MYFCFLKLHIFANSNLMAVLKLNIRWWIWLFSANFGFNCDFFYFSFLHFFGVRLILNFQFFFLFPCVFFDLLYFVLFLFWDELVILFLEIEIVDDFFWTLPSVNFIVVIFFLVRIPFCDDNQGVEDVQVYVRSNLTLSYIKYM